MRILPSKNKYSEEKISRDALNTIITITPRNESDIPNIFYFPNVSFKNNTERITIKITFVLMSADAVEALVRSIPTN